jgi:hypothetical protein
MTAGPAQVDELRGMPMSVGNLEEIIDETYAPAMQGWCSQAGLRTVEEMHWRGVVSGGSIDSGDRWCSQAVIEMVEEMHCWGFIPGVPLISGA